MASPAPTADPVLERLHRELPEMFPRYGTRWEQYLMSWEPAWEESGRGIRSRLHGLRQELRAELGIPSRPERPGSGPADRRRAFLVSLREGLHRLE